MSAIVDDAPNETESLNNPKIAELTDSKQETPKKSEKPLWKLVALSVSVMSIHISYSSHMIYAIPLLLKYHFPEELKSYVWPWSPLLTICFAPILGPLSDSCTLSLGRRRPFIIVLSLMIATGALILSQSANVVLFLDAMFLKDEMKSGSANSTGDVMNLNGETYSKCLQPLLIVITLIAVTMADFSCDSCQAPSRAYILDVVPAEDHKRAMSVVGVSVGIGGTLGYLSGVINYENTRIGQFLGGQEETVFIIASISVVTLMTIAVCQEKEIPLESSKETSKRQGLWKTYKRYVSSILQMPKKLKVLCLQSICFWFCVHCTSLFISDFVGQAVFDGDPCAEENSEQLNDYNRGVRFGSFAMASMTLTIALTSSLLGKFLNFVRCRILMIVTCLLVGAAYVSNIFWPSRVAVMILSLAVGQICMCVIVIPSLLLARYHNDDNLNSNQLLESEKKPKRGFGTDAQVLWATLPASQFTISMIRGPFDFITGLNTGGSMYLGVVAITIAAILTFFVDFVDL